MQNELKPCPFCKETEFIEVRFEKLFNVDFHYVRCQICCARGLDYASFYGHEWFFCGQIRRLA